jgi:preprotein translocase subunit SecD
VLVAALLAGCESGGKPAASPSATQTTATATATATPAPTAAARTASVSFVVAGGDPSAAARVLHGRLLAFGLNPGDPAVAGTSVTFQVTRRPTSEEAAVLSRRGHLTFRGVVEAHAANAAAGGDAGDCADAAYRTRLATANGGPDADARRVVACAATGDAKYLLGPVEMTGRDVRSAEAAAETFGQDPMSRWVVTVTMTSASRWAALTEKYVGQQLAIVLDGVVQSAPTVEQRIPDGSASVSGSFTEASARALAAVLRGGALPANAVVTVSS